MGRENIFKLTGNAGRFVRENIPAFRNQAAIAFPCFLLFALAVHFSEALKYEWIKSWAAFPIMYFAAAFSLGWHRVSLQGPDAERVNPFRWKAKDGRFYAVYMGLIVLLYIFNKLAGYTGPYLENSENNAVVIIGTISWLIVIAALFVFCVRAVFLLPALSVGAEISYEDAKKSSRGSFLPLVISAALSITTLILIISVYLLIVTLVLQATGSNVEADNIFTVLVSFFLSIPAYAAMFFWLAVNISVISRLYQWGIQNNA